MGGPVGILRSVFFLENVCSLIFVVSLVVSGLFLDAKKRPLKYSGGIWKKVERPSHADEMTSVSKRNVIWFGKLVCLDLPIYRFNLC